MATSDKRNGSYIFQRNSKSSVRLNYNHFIVKHVTGFLLHPKIALRDDMRIADVGTGTGIWATELAAMLPPTVRIDGFDISGDQYPPSSLKPSNIHFATHDCFKPFPQEYIGKFDVVHARFWLCIVNDPVAATILENFVSLLKPGGHLQWIEPMVLSTRIITPNDTVSKKAAERLAATRKKPRPDSAYSWVEGLADLCTNMGMQIEANDRIEFTDCYRPLWAQSTLLAMEDMAVDIELVDSTKAKQTMEFMKALEEEYAQGVVVDTPFQCVVSRK